LRVRDVKSASAQESVRFILSISKMVRRGDCMRWDYPLYAVAVVCFVLAICAQMACPVAPISTIIMIIIGLAFVGLGYWKRPKASNVIQ